MFAFACLCASACANAQQQVEAPRADGASTPLVVYESGATERGCAPLALISHGAGGSERGLRYLGEAFARDGWRAIVVGHRESGLGPLGADMRKAGVKQGIADLVSNADAYRARFMDIAAARAWSDKNCRTPYTALLGHSMGAVTVMLEAGATNKLGVTGEGGFDAYVALSPEGPGAVFAPDAWRPIRAPMLLITGTRDRSLEGDCTWRTQAYDGLPLGCHWLAVVDGVNHMDFGGAHSANQRVGTVTATLVTRYLEGLRAGRCTVPPRLAGVTLRTK